MKNTSKRTALCLMALAMVSAAVTACGNDPAEIPSGGDGTALENTPAALETVGLITEALNAESYKRIIPAYYETTLKNKGVRDEESIALLDLIVDSRVFDIGYVYDGWSGASFFFQKLVYANNNNLASMWKTNEKAVTKHYNKVIDFFNNYDKN